jgi:hypothetical protein
MSNNKVTVRLHDGEAERLSRLAEAHCLSEQALLRTLIRWLPTETVSATVQQSKGCLR